MPVEAKKKKPHTRPSSEGCSVFSLSGLPVTGPKDAIFVTLAAGGSVCFKPKGGKRRHDLIRQQPAGQTSAEMQTQRENWVRKCHPVILSDFLTVCSNTCLGYLKYLIPHFTPLYVCLYIFTT